MNVRDHDERYEPVNDSLLGTGSYGYTKLMRERGTGRMYALKYIERGEKITEHVRREIVNHRNLSHPNIVKFKEVLVTPTHLAVAMEAIGGGELFSYVQQQGKFHRFAGEVFLSTLDIWCGVFAQHANLASGFKVRKHTSRPHDDACAQDLRFWILGKEVSTVSRRHKLGRQRIYREFTVAHSRMMAQLQTYGLVGYCCMSC